MSNPFSPTSVEYLAAALPPDGANPVGNAARGILVNHLKGATPGHWSQLFGTGPAFKDVFFPGLRRDPRESEIQRVTGLDDGFFKEFAVCSVCQQIGFSTSSIRSQIQMNPISSDLASWNGRLRQTLWAWYAYCLGAVDGDVRTALAAFPDEQSRALARAHYLQGLTGDAWVNDKLVQLASGSWTNATWELFHHWTKLVALGAPTADIDQAISTIVGKGLPIPPEVGAGAWRSWTGWFGESLGGRDLPEAVAPILATKCQVYPGARFPSCLAEAASYEFTANTQPGNRYRRAPSGSCFTVGTRVVMATGETRPIEEVGPGDEVATPSGPRRVVINASPLRDGRGIQGLQGLDFGLMATHPFVAQSPGADPPFGYAAADPEGLARAVPTLAQFGIQPLREGAPLLAHAPGGQAIPFAAPRLVERTPGPGDVVHDLILEPTADGRSEYFVGDRVVQLLVSSEIPRYLAAPATAAVIVSVLQSCSEPILGALAAVPDSGFADLLAIGLDAAARVTMPRVGPALRTPGGLMALASTPEQVLADVGQLAAALGSGDEYDRRAASLVEQFIPRFAPQFQAAISLGWRSFSLATPGGATVLAVSPYSFELLDGSRALESADAEVVLTLRVGDATWSRSVRVKPAASTDHRFFTCDEVAYFAEWRPTLGAPSQEPTGGRWTLGLHLRRRSTGQDLPGSAVLPLPSVLSDGYEAFALPVLAGGVVLGRVAFDLRALGPDGLREDLEGRSAWQPEDEGFVASRLAAEVSGILTNEVTAGVLVFHDASATPEGLAAGAAMVRLPG